MYNRPIQSFLEHALFAFASSTLSMTPIADTFARIIADVDQLYNGRFNEVELVRSGTRRIHRRLDLMLALTAPCSPHVPIENGATVELAWLYPL